MFNLQEVLDSRLATLEGKKNRKSINQNNVLNDISEVYIKKSLTQAGILNKKGKLVKHITTA